MLQSDVESNRPRSSVTSKWRSSNKKSKNNRRSNEQLLWPRKRRNSWLTKKRKQSRWRKSSEPRRSRSSRCLKQPREKMKGRSKNKRKRYKDAWLRWLAVKRSASSLLLYNNSNMPRCCRQGERSRPTKLPLPRNRTKVFCSSDVTNSPWENVLLRRSVSSLKNNAA